MVVKTFNWIFSTSIALNATLLQAADWGSIPEQASDNGRAKVLYSYV